MELRGASQLVQESQDCVLDQHIVLADKLRDCPELRSKPLLTKSFVTLHSRRVIFIEVYSIGIVKESGILRLSSRKLSLFCSTIFRIFSSNRGKMTDSFEKSLFNVIVTLTHAPCAKEF